MRKSENLFRLVVILLAVSSASLLLEIFNGSENAFATVCSCIGAIVFYGAMIAGYVLLAVINKRRKEAESGKRRKNTLPGIVCFFRNPFAAAADIVSAITLILSAVAYIWLSNDVLIIFLAFCIFSLHMHGILNGVNYKYIKNIHKGEKS